MSGSNGNPGRQAGVTLIEVMMVVTIAAVVAVLALPRFGTLMEKMRLRGAAEALYADLHYARSEALKTKQNTFVSFTPGAAGAWCWGVNTAVCDCAEDDDTAADHCDLGRVAAADYPNVTLAIPGGFLAGTEAHQYTVFEPSRGTTIVTTGGSNWHPGTARFTSPSSMQKEVVVATMGRVRISEHYGSE